MQAPRSAPRWGSDRAAFLLPKRAIIDASLEQFQDFIRKNLPIGPVSTVPEVLLHRAGPRSGLWRLAERSGRGSPYWAFDWGGGLALARHVLDHAETVANRTVLDLGAGSGIVGIAAMKAGASRVIAADIDPYAIAAIGLNAAANGVCVTPILNDLTSGAPPAVDIVLVGDLFYEQKLADAVTAFLRRCVEAGIQVLIGDPWRVALPRERLRLLAEYPGPDFGGGGHRSNAVFSLEPA